MPANSGRNRGFLSVQRISALFMSRSVLPFSVGVMPPDSLATQMSEDHWLPYASNSTKDLPLWVPAHNLAPRFIGSYPIVEVISPVEVRLRLPGPLRRIHPVFHVSEVKLVCRSLHVRPVPGRLRGLWSGGKMLGPGPVHLGPFPH